MLGGKSDRIDVGKRGSARIHHRYLPSRANAKPRRYARSRGLEDISGSSEGRAEQIADYYFLGLRYAVIDDRQHVEEHRNHG